MISNTESLSLGEIAKKAREICAHSPVLNLILNMRAPIPSLDDPFIQGYIDEAREWQSKKRPSKLWFSHGEYMHKYGDAIEYLVGELKAKPTGNRACISLTNTADFIGSDDGPLPSFLLLQCGFESKSQEVLYVTAYYRALEVTAFLPINLAEMALIASAISSKIPTIGTLDLTIHAFRAHATPGFRPLEHSELDAASQVRIKEVVVGKDVNQIVKWLTDKLRPESLVDITGITTLLRELGTSDWANERLVRSLETVVSAMTQLQEARRSGSHAAAIDSLQERVARGLQVSIDIMRQIA